MPPPSIDFALLERDNHHAQSLNRRALAWLAALLLLLAALLVGLVGFLQGVEADDQERRRQADAQWLDQTLRFHFRRLEDDLQAQAQLALRGEPATTGLPHAGWLWRTGDSVATHAWWPAPGPAPRLDGWRPIAPNGPGDALSTMLDTTRGLERAAYAGPLPGPAGEPWLWLAVPTFSQGAFLGHYVAGIRLQQAIDRALPDWFTQDHRVSVVFPVRDTANTPTQAPINLPGAQLVLDVQTTADGPGGAPRAFFAIALLCLGGMGATLLLLWRDVRRRQRLEARLQTQMALRSAMERSVGLGLCAWDLAGQRLYVNPAFAALVGYPSEALLGQHDAPYWPDSAASEWERLRPLRQWGEEAQTGLELTLRHRDGHAIEALVHLAPLALADGQAVGWIGSVLDVTERKRTERLAARQQELLEASGRLVAVGEVASTLAHELNQPLGALSGFANGLLNRLRDRRITLDDVTPVVERIERMADKAGRVIQRVNAFARRQEPSRQPLPLAPFVERVAAQLPLPDGVVLEIQQPLADVTVPADALLLEHALHNLLLNATEWASLAPGGKPQARVRVGIHRQGQGPAEEVALVVEDSGPGVTPALLPTLFDAFASGKPGGMGMGLAICRSIAEAHHGRIEVGRSTDLHGAQFSLWLPLHP